MKMTQIKDRLEDLEKSIEELKEIYNMEWSRKYVNDLPDSAFAWIEPGGKKDETGKTVPRSLRHLPYKDATGKVDLPHVRNALARINQVKGMPKSVQDRVRAKLKKLLGD